MQPHVSAQKYWALHERPDGEVSPLLINGQFAIPYFHHIHVVMGVEVDVVEYLCVCEHDGGDEEPRRSRCNI